MKNWHVWTIDQNRYRRIEEFIQGIPEVESYLYPLISKEYDTGKSKKLKDIPLYSNYIFLFYNHSPELLNKLTLCPWIKTYVGVCSQEEIEDVKELTKKRYEDLVPTKELEVGNRYRLKGTPFKGLICTIVDILDKDKLVVTVELFGADKFIKCSIEDLELEG